jgi:hypothetical protein
MGRKSIEMTTLTEEGVHGSTPQHRRALRGDAQDHERKQQEACMRRRICLPETGDPCVLSPSDVMRCGQTEDDESGKG